MKNKLLISFACLPLLILSTVNAQKYQVTWGEENKMKRGTTEMNLIYADNSGAYLLLGQMKMQSYFVIGATYKGVYDLVKYDRNFNLVYDKDYSKDLMTLVCYCSPGIPELPLYE